MAVYWNLVVDCGSNEIAANQIAQRFRQMLVVIPPLSPIELHVGVTSERGKYFVGVWPRGMGLGIPQGTPHGPGRPELLTEEMVAQVGLQLLRELATLSDYRRAMFGAECFDTFVYATADEDDDIDYVDLIFSTEHFPTIPVNLTTSEFAKDYRKVDSRIDSAAV